MRMLRYALLLAALSAPLSCFAQGMQGTIQGYEQPYVNISGPNQIDGVSINPNIAAAGNFSTLNTDATTPQGTVFSSVITGNPLMLQTVQNIVVAQVNATGGYAFLSGVAGRRIFPGVGVITAYGGSAATGTREIIECSPSGFILASIAVSELVSGIGVPFSSTAVNNGYGYTGCNAGDSVIVSNVGSPVATATGFNISLPYTVQ